MVHLAFFDNFTVLSPPPYNVGSVCSKCPPWSNIVWGGEGRAMFGKKSRFYHRTGGDNENKANFQGVPYTFDQDCSPPMKSHREIFKLQFYMYIFYGYSVQCRTNYRALKFIQRHGSSAAVWMPAVSSASSWLTRSQANLHWYISLPHGLYVFRIPVILIFLNMQTDKNRTSSRLQWQPFSIH